MVIIGSLQFRFYHKYLFFCSGDYKISRFFFNYFLNHAEISFLLMHRANFILPTRTYTT